MKFTVNVDCTPEEARAFLGLPDVKPMQEQLMHELQAQIAANIRAMSPDEMMKIWLPVGLAGFEPMRDFFSKMAAGKRE